MATSQDAIATLAKHARAGPRRLVTYLGIYGVAAVSLVTTMVILALNYRSAVGHGLAPPIRTTL